MENGNLVELIKSSKPRAALFTTYTLSLSFFETVILPVLRQVGCQDIAILVDANEAVTSLAETNAYYAGRRYWVIPVTAPGGGVFHPKLTYLVGQESDVLTIGSGNLTLPGQSLQLETLDAVASSDNPIVFGQFAEFANKLANGIEKSSMEGAKQLRIYEERARSIVATNNANPTSFPKGPFLIHTVDQVAISTILDLWRLMKTDARSLTVLSPFHAPDASPLYRLADELNLDNLSIGLDPKTLTAPFEKKRLLPSHRICYVTPKLDDEARSLHAKAFEITSDEGALVITGSINATHQSLETTKNIEVSLARWLPSPCFKWEIVDPVNFESNIYEFKNHGANFAFLEALINTNGVIEGRVFGNDKIPESGMIYLLRNEIPLKGDPHQITVNQNGTFKFGPIDELDTDGSLQLKLIAGEIEATCWLNIVQDLNSTDSERKDRQCVRNILRGDFKSDDVMDLIHIFSRAISYEYSSKTEISEVTEKNTSPSDVDSDRPFSYQQWQLSGHSNRNQGLVGIRYDDTLKAFIRYLNADTQAFVTPDHPSSHPSTSTPAFKNVSEKDSPQEKVDIEGLLRQLIESIPKLLSEHPDVPNADILASVSAAHALKLMLTSTWQNENRLGPSLAWLDTYSRYPYAEIAKERLQSIALGIAMVTAGLAKQYHLDMPDSRIKESLLRFGFNPTDLSIVNELVLNSLNSEIFLRVDQKLKDIAKIIFSEVWAAQLVDDRLFQLVTASRNPSARLDPKDDALFPGVFSALKLSRPKAEKPFRDGVLTNGDLDGNRGGCPHCFERFDNPTKKYLRAQHAIICKKGFCGKVVFYLEDPNAAAQIKEALSHV